jgi:hypothetical protein
MADNDTPDHGPEPKGKHEEGQAGHPCPVCGADYYEADFCLHFVGTWDYSEDGGWWVTRDGYQVKGRDWPPGGTQTQERRSKTLFEFETLIGNFVDGVVGAAEEVPPHYVKQIIPGHLLDLVNESLDYGHFGSFTANKYLESLIEGAPTFAGSLDFESHGCGSSSSWTCYYARDAIACARDVEQHMADDNRQLRDAIARLSTDYPRSEGS